MTAPTDPKHRVTMASVQLDSDGQVERHEATDYVPASILDAYVTDARARWQSVTVSDEIDYGPGGPAGDTATLDHLQES